MVKSSNFWQKPWTNPVGKFGFFKLVWNFTLIGLESILFYPEYPKTMFSGLICPKNTHGKKVLFFDKNHGLTPLENFDFLDFFNTLLFFSQNHSFFYPEYQKTFFSGLIRIVRNSMFWKKPWNNPSGKFRFFWIFLKLFFSGQKSTLFHPEYI